MVFKRRIDCGSNDGFNFPNIPKAPRSCRRKTLTKKPDDDSQICAFDLLASLAGKLLQESESSSASNNAFEVDNQNGVGKEIKQEQEDECKLLKSAFSDQGNFDAKSTYENTSEKCLLNKFSYFEDDGILERTSMPGYGRVHDLKPAGCEDKKEFCKLPIGLEGTSGETGESVDFSVNNGFEQKVEATKGLTDGVLIANTCCKKDTTQSCATFPESVHSDRDRKSSACTKPVPNASFARHGNLTKLGSRDDDEKFYRSYKFSSKFKPYRPPSRIGDRRIRKLLSSKYWKAVPKLKDYEYRADGGLRSLYRKRKACYGYNRWQSDIVYKRRRSSDRGSVVTSDGGLSSESVTNSPEKGDTANGVLSPSKGLRSKDSHVKFSIKSFKIPELFIEVPETATVGSLKRTVLEAVTALLGDGVHVGVLVQGKKVRDDSKTLSQTGLSCEENSGNLGFTLEPGPDNTPMLLCSEDPLVSIPSDSSNLSKRSPDSPMLDSGIPGSFPDSDGFKNSGDHVENNNCELVPYQSGILADEPTSDSRALVPVPSLDVEALAIVPVNQKPKRSELTHRRTRRPFSVSEVEALVQAVEELGTGRWRDVKLRAFENADHRTYVDLKDVVNSEIPVASSVPQVMDKWKTLVHTASISPQQRRGEPVPQELLDRVLGAHSYWSQHQAKQHGKHQAGALKVADNPTDDWNRIGATELQTGSM